MYTIGEKQFSTKNEIKEYIRNICNGILKTIKRGEQKEITEQEHRSFLLELLLYHTEDKIKVGIKKIIIQHNQYNKSSFQTLLEYVDGSTDDISFLWCVDCISKDGEKRIPTNTDLQQCMRKAIKDYIGEFYADNDKTCAKCKNAVADSYEVDHIVKFRDLAKDFLVLQPELNVPTIFKKDLKFGGYKFKKIDKKFSDEWFEYHKEHSKLRILCKPCNRQEH